MRTSKRKSFLFFSPFFLCFALFWVVPFVYGIFMSFHKFSLFAGNSGFAGLKNFKTIFTLSSRYSMEFMKALKFTMLFVVISVPLLVIISLALALLLDNLPRKAQNIFRTIFFVSYAISVTSVAAIFNWLFSGNSGYVNTTLLRLHLISSPVRWLEAQPFATLTIVITTVWWTIGFNMMLFINALNEIDTALYEASAIDGASFWVQFKSIIMPSIRSVFGFVVINTIFASFNLYGQPYLITRGGPQQSTTSLIMCINDTIFLNNNLGVGSAMALVMGIVVMLFAFAQHFLTREKKEVLEVQR